MGEDFVRSCQSGYHCITFRHPVEYQQGILQLFIMMFIPSVSVRLSGSVLRQEGYVEMYTNTTGWGSVCGQGWENQDGRVICRMLGYPGKAEEAGLHITCGIDQVARLLCSNAGRV